MKVRVTTSGNAALGCGGQRFRRGLACAVTVGTLAFAGCGSSKPAYCSTRSSLENSVNGLTHLNASSGVSALKTQVQKIESEATALVHSAKSDFPSQTEALKSSIDKLTAAVKALPPSPSARDVASLAGEVAGVVSSASSFADATKDKCS